LMAGMRLLRFGEDPMAIRVIGRATDQSWFCVREGLGEMTLLVLPEDRLRAFTVDQDDPATRGCLLYLGIR
jgi:hypothetical protein